MGADNHNNDGLNIPIRGDSTPFGEAMKDVAAKMNNTAKEVVETQRKAEDQIVKSVESA